MLSPSASVMCDSDCMGHACLSSFARMNRISHLVLCTPQLHILLVLLVVRIVNLVESPLVIVSPNRPPLVRKTGGLEGGKVLLTLRKQLREIGHLAEALREESCGGGGGG